MRARLGLSGLNAGGRLARWRPASALLAALVLASGCTLITSIDRGRIAEEDAGTPQGGNSQGGSTAQGGQDAGQAQGGSAPDASVPDSGMAMPDSGAAGSGGAAGTGGSAGAAGSPVDSGLPDGGD